MKADEIRRRFLDYFQLRGHEVLSSGSLVPHEDPTLLFTNAGMVPFKKVFLGEEALPHPRVATVQKCVRAGGKHNDLEQVGETARHHTFFEMLGNFSFGDYFKRDAIHLAWGFLTQELGMDPARLFVTVHETDQEAFGLWQEVAGLDQNRIFRLGDRDNFWQMADTGPCGPCSEVHYDLRPLEGQGIPTVEAFEALGEEGWILELWNLVFMQYDRDAEGNLNPLPARSIDTGAGLERIAAVLQAVDSNYHTDLFRPLLDRVSRVVGRPYDSAAPTGTSYRVLADHARAVAFLLADGVFPSNEGRGYVLRRILRRAVRHAWLLGMRAPVVVEVVDEVIALMGDAYPELRERRPLLLETTRREEERFLSTIEGGMVRFDEIAPERVEPDPDDTPAVIPGEEVFKLYDTFGFPPDLTQVMARERGYGVDEASFEAALERQRARSRADRAESGVGMDREGGLEGWTLLVTDPEQRWIGWESTEAVTSVLGTVSAEGEVGVILRENPFYHEAGGQVSDTGIVEGEDWRIRVGRVGKVGSFLAVFGPLEGRFPAGTGGPFPARAQVDREARHDTERNHTATHLLHAALRKVLGAHVTQRGSLVAPDRLRFDFSHPSPLSGEEIAEIEREVNREIWADHPVEGTITSREEAVSRGAMALFGEKYGEEVRVVEIAGVSLELCGGNHLRHTGEAGLFTVTRESGVASGVRRIEAMTGPAAYDRLREAEAELVRLGDQLRVGRVGLPRRIDELLRERAELEELLEHLRRGGGGAASSIIHEVEVPLGDGVSARYRALRLKVRDADDARTFGDAFRAEESWSVAAVAAESPDGTVSLLVVVTDDLIGRGVKAGDLVKVLASAVGGRGGGRSHMAQGGVEEPEKLDRALREGEAALRRVVEELQR